MISFFSMGANDSTQQTQDVASRCIRRLCNVDDFVWTRLINNAISLSSHEQVCLNMLVYDV